MVNGAAGWLGWCSSSERAQAAAALAIDHGADGVVIHRGEAMAVMRATGGDGQLADLLRIDCDMALYRTATRHVLRHVRTWPPDTPTPGVTMLFSIHRRSGMAAADFHDWWEQSHAAVALRHHVGMWDYAQVSVVETLHGDPWDGFAVTQWPTLDDLMHRFSSGPEGTEALRHDAAQFTDPATLRRHLLDELVLVDTPWPATGEVPVGIARSMEMPEGLEIETVTGPDGVSAEVRPTTEGRPRLDVLWRTVIPAAEAPEIPAAFDALCEAIAAQVGGDNSVVE